jgi:hypothetical protein
MASACYTLNGDIYFTPGALCMQRRDVLRLLTSTAALSVIPLEAMVTMQQARAQIGQFSGVRTMNAHQNETVTTISELIIPQTDTPGARGAKVNEFIDLLLTEWFDAPEKERFLEGLATIDTASRKRFRSDFISCTPAQQKELMKQFDDEAMSFARRQRSPLVVRTTSARTQKPRTTPAIDREPLHPGEFFYTLKKFTIFGYYTSEIGFSQELGDSIIPPGHDGCAPLKESTK